MVGPRMHRIFSSIVGAFLKNDFAAELQGIAPLVVTSAIEIYNIIQQVQRQRLELGRARGYLGSWTAKICRCDGLRHLNI
jgi:hypothetical protein